MALSPDCPVTTIIICNFLVWKLASVSRRRADMIHSSIILISCLGLGLSRRTTYQRTRNISTGFNQYILVSTYCLNSINLKKMIHYDFHGFEIVNPINIFFSPRNIFVFPLPRNIFLPGTG